MSEERMITMTNSERRDKGLLYITDETVLAEQVPARRLTQKLNTMDRADFEGIKAVIKELFAECGDAFVNPPFYCDYGHHISVGKCFYANYGCTMLDAGFIRIGDYCKFGPNVSIYAAGHPVHPAARNTAYEYGADVTIGNTVWIGGNTVVCPGVTIGDNVVIGAGSVVTKDIPSNCIAAGNPCRVIRMVSEEDRFLARGKITADPEAAEDMKRMWEESGDEVRYPTI